MAETNSQLKSAILIDFPAETQFNGSTDCILSEDKKGKSCFRKKMIYRRLPFLTWITKYSPSDAIGDLIAGITCGMIAIPAGLAYASIAELSPQYGLYSSFMGCFVYVLLGTCKDITIGPTAVATLFIAQTAGGVWQRAVLLTFLTGLTEIVMGIFRLGFLVDFISGPVNSGFTTAVSLIVLTSQVKNVFNIKTTGITFIEMWTSIFQNISKAHIGDTVLGLGCITFLVTVRWLGRLQIGPKEKHLRSSFQNVFNKCLWVMGIARNCVLVVVCAFMAWYLEQNGHQYFALVGYIPQGFPRFALPPFSIPDIRINNTNGEETIIQQGESFIDMITSMGSGLIVVPLIAMVENSSVCKAFAQGKPIDATQELFAMGVSNICNSFFQGYRANAGLGRSSVNNASGCRTQMANLYIASIVVLSLIYLTPYFAFIPNATLAATAIGSVIFTIQYSVIVPMWRSNRIDLIPAFTTFIACLVLPLQVGIFVGIAVNMVFVLYYSARPKITVNALQTSNGHSFVMLTPDRSLIFPSVEYVRNIINKSGVKTNLPVVVNCSYIYAADFTAAKAIAMLVKDFHSRNQKIIFYNFKPSVSRVFESVTNQLILCYNKLELENELTKYVN